MDQMKIGAYLKELRKEKNLAQEQMADEYGVDLREIPDRILGKLI